MTKVNTIDELNNLEDELILLQVKIMQGNNLNRVGITNSHKEEVLQLLEQKVTELMIDEKRNFVPIQTINNFIVNNF